MVELLLQRQRIACTFTSTYREPSTCSSNEIKFCIMANMLSLTTLIYCVCWRQTHKVFKNWNYINKLFRNFIHLAFDTVPLSVVWSVLIQNEAYLDLFLESFENHILIAFQASIRICALRFCMCGHWRNIRWLANTKWF